MSKYYEIETLIEESDNKIEGLYKDYEKERETLQKERTKLVKQQVKLKEQYEKKIQKKFGRVKVNVELDRYGVTIKEGSIEVIYTYDEFSFKGVEKELAVEIKYLFEELYGEPKELSRDTGGLQGFIGGRPLTTAEQYLEEILGYRNFG